MAKAKLTRADRIVITVLHRRKLTGQDLLAELFRVTAMTMTISRTAREVGQPLETHGCGLTADAYSSSADQPSENPQATPHTELSNGTAAVRLER
jgi:hypothetical protein